MIVVGIYIKDSVTLEYNRVELFDDEKISVNSSIQNINDISKTYTDFSQTFTVPASKQNNKIFRHWYENSNDNGFSTLVKADAYIEIDAIHFRSGKIQLESASVKDGQPQDYSITFIGALGSLKDKFNGLYLKDLTDTTYDFNYTANLVRDKIVTTAASSDIMFPLISSSRYWTYGSGDNINSSSTPIRFNELFPAIKLSAVLNMIQNDSNILNLNFNGSFLSDARFTNAYLWLKNADIFETITKEDLITFQNTSAITYSAGANPQYNAFKVPPLLNDTVYRNSINEPSLPKKTYSLTLTISPTIAGIPYTINTYFLSAGSTVEYLLSSETKTSIVGNQTFIQSSSSQFNKDSGYRYKIVSDSNITFNASILLTSYIRFNNTDFYSYQTISKSANQTLTASTVIHIKKYMPEIKVEDFFSGLLKMFNLTCYSTDGINYTVEQLESYYTSGTIRDITKYIKSDSINLNRVKTYKKINFEYEKSESLVNKGFLGNSGQEYGSLFYDTQNDGDEYNIKLPFEDLNFNNLQDKLQVGYALKTDLQKYIPKPVILYDYNPSALTTLTGTTFYFSNSTSGSGTGYTSYKAFGQEYFDGTNTYSLNFNQQQSTLTNESISDSLYNEYYENYLANIFDSKARLIKVSGILPTSLLTTLKLNDRLIIRDKRYLINTFTTDLTTGEVQFELLTDFRELEPIKEIIIETQTWTNSNLNVETYRDGTVIPQVTDPTAWANLTTGAWCYYNNDPANGDIYGKLYNWYAVNDTRGLAPLGYHVPSQTEWNTLGTYLGGDSVAGGKMKSPGITLWQSPNTAATNSSGFTAIPGGCRLNIGVFYAINQSGYFWSSSELSSSNAYFRRLNSSNGSLDNVNYEKDGGFSVRLIKD